MILSYQCNAECRHCMYASSPKWRGWMSEDDLRLLLSQLTGKIEPSRWGPNGVELNLGLHFTGGEPFLNFRLLLRAVEISTELGIPSTFVETNCFWAGTEEKTREMLVQLKEKGLKGILISVNPFFLEHVPFQRTERVIKIAREIFGPNVLIYQQAYYWEFKILAIEGKFDPTTTLPLEKYLEISYRPKLEGVEIFLMGRAAYKLRDLFPTYPAEQFLDEPCPFPLIRSWHNHFDNYGNFIPGYCAGISLGPWSELEGMLKEGVELDKKPILHLLVKEDFRGLLRFAKERGYREPPEGYVSKCHLCTDVRRFLVEHGNFAELQPVEFYEYLE